MEGKLQREFFTQKTLFSMLHLQYLKDRKTRRKKKAFWHKNGDYHKHKNKHQLELHKSSSFDITMSRKCDTQQFYKMCIKPTLYRNVISSPSANCFLLAYDTFQMQLVKGKARYS